jgi:hypothetical protein
MAWHTVGEEVILFKDVNGNIYTGPLLKLYKAMGYRWRIRPFVPLGKRHHTVTALGRWQ